MDKQGFQILIRRREALQDALSIALYYGVRDDIRVYGLATALRADIDMISKLLEGVSTVY